MFSVHDVLAPKQQIAEQRHLKRKATGVIMTRKQKEKEEQAWKTHPSSPYLSDKPRAMLHCPAASQP